MTRPYCMPTELSPSRMQLRMQGIPLSLSKHGFWQWLIWGGLRQHRTELKKVLARSDVQSNHGYLRELNSTAAKLARIQNDIPGAIAYMTEALNQAVLMDARKDISEFQSELSDLYRLSGNLPKAEELANEAATSAQSFGIIPLVPRLLNVLAEIQIDAAQVHRS